MVFWRFRISIKTRESKFYYLYVVERLVYSDSLDLMSTATLNNLEVLVRF
jgi:hypothetical protein